MTKSIFSQWKNDSIYSFNSTYNVSSIVSQSSHWIYIDKIISFKVYSTDSNKINFNNNKQINYIQIQSKIYNFVKIREKENKINRVISSAQSNEMTS